MTTSTSTPTKTAKSGQIHLSANFASKQPEKKPSEGPNSIGYDHEVYLQLIGGGKVTKTPNQLYQEERAQHLKIRANDPAISDPQGEPSPVDFECVEMKSVRR